MTNNSDFERGLQLHQSGATEQAEAFYLRVPASAPDYRNALHYLGVIDFQRGLFQGAVDKFERVAALYVDCSPPAEFFVNFGNALKRCGQREQALASYEHAKLLAPGFALAWYNMGLLFRQQGDELRALTPLEKACELSPNLSDAWLELGECQLQLGNDSAALSSLRRAVGCAALSPSQGAAVNRVGRALIRSRRYAAAIDVLRHAPQDHETRLLSGCALSGAGRMTDAESVFRRLSAESPDNISYLDNLANVLKDTGRVDDALSVYRRINQRLPPISKSNYLFSLLYSDATAPHAVFEEHLCVAEESSISTHEVTPTFERQTDLDAPLRIGYLSGDFYNHPVAHFIFGILKNHDQNQFEVHLYYNNIVNDDWTDRLRSTAPHWRNVESFSDEALLSQIHRDRIDILIDLSGHTADNRLAVFRKRAAPVQVSYLGYPFSTATKNVDWRIVDGVVDPPGAEAFSTERLWRLPRSYYAYSNTAGAPDPNELPLSQLGRLTFGVTSNLAKVTPTTLDHWTTILKGFPNSQLSWRAKAFGDLPTRKRMLNALIARGLDKRRLKLVEWARNDQRWLCYHAIDVALDTFPYNQATNTCEALWMGVPTISVAGSVHQSRMGASILGAAGLNEWIVLDPNDLRSWIDRSKTLLSENHLADLRTSMRSRLIDQPLLDTVGLTKLIETAYRGMYRQSEAHFKKVTPP